MPERVSLPGASELFRTTAPITSRPPTPESTHEPVAQPTRPPNSRDEEPSSSSEESRGASGRVKHDEKITVYLSSDELLALEEARLRLRKQLGTRVDRGRIVRAAIAMSLSDLNDNGIESKFVEHLRGS